MVIAASRPGCCGMSSGYKGTPRHCEAEPSYAGLAWYQHNRELWWAFACRTHARELEVPRLLTDRDCVELARRRAKHQAALEGRSRWRPDDPLATGAAGRRLLEDARTRARYSPIDTPGCIVRRSNLPPEYSTCHGQVTHAGLLALTSEVYLVFACAEHASEIIAARPLLDRDRAELANRRERASLIHAGHHVPPVEPIKVGTAARRLVDRARAWATQQASQ